MRVANLALSQDRPKLSRGVRGRRTYRIAGNFRGRKLSRIGRKRAFRGENFRGMQKLIA